MKSLMETTSQRVRELEAKLAAEVEERGKAEARCKEVQDELERAGRKRAELEEQFRPSETR